MLPDHDFVKPGGLAEALQLLSAEPAGVKLLGGGTDVVFNMRGRLFAPERLLSLSDIRELQQVERSDDGSLVLGAGCRLSDLERHPEIVRESGLHASIRAVASRHVRNMATLGGNLNLDTRCWYTNQTEAWRDARGACLKTGEPVCHAIRSSAICVALNASDIAPALVALDAEVELASADATRTMPLAGYYTDDGIEHTVRRPDEIMTRVIVPASNARMTFVKETARKGNDFAYGTIAARATGKGDTASGMRLVLGSLTTRPLRLKRTAAMLEEGGLGDASLRIALDEVRDELGPLTNLYTPAAYKARIARSLVREAVDRLREQSA